MSANILGDYLQNMMYKKDSGNEITHTKIGSKENNIYGASYTINNNDEFLSCYFKQLKLGGNFYLTEKQLDSDDRMLVVDLIILLKQDNITKKQLKILLIYTLKKLMKFMIFKVIQKLLLLLWKN